jgi:hypothetical protein
MSRARPRGSIREQAGPIAVQRHNVCHDILDFIQVPGYPSAIETPSLPALTRSYPRRFTFYVAWPAAPFARLSTPAVMLFNASRGL